MAVGCILKTLEGTYSVTNIHVCRIWYIKHRRIEINDVSIH